MTGVPQDRSGVDRRAAASLEVVLAAGVSLPVVALLATLGLRACRNLFHVVSNLVGWPYL